MKISELCKVIENATYDGGAFVLKLPNERYTFVTGAAIQQNGNILLEIATDDADYDSLRPIVKVEDSVLDVLISAFTTDPDRIYRVRFAIDEGGVKVKINEGVWSPPIGEIEKR